MTIAASLLRVITSDNRVIMTSRPDPKYPDRREFKMTGPKDIMKEFEETIEAYYDPEYPQEKETVNENNSD